MSTYTPSQGLSRRLSTPSIRTVSTLLEPESQSLFISSPKAQGESDAKLTRAEAKQKKMESVLE